MKYDKWAERVPIRSATRRTALRAALALGIAGGFSLLHAPAHTPRSNAPLRGTTDPKPGAKPAAGAAAGRAESAYRLSPSTGGPLRQAAPAPLGAPWRPVAVRPQAHETLREGGHKMALTFDDGPHPTQTKAVLRILRRHGVRATFFVIGENAAANPDLLRAIAADGHLVGNHSYTHPQLDLIETSRVRTELSRTCDVIDKTLRQPPRLARAPYGMWDKRGLKICAALQMEPFQWSIDTNDWAEPGRHSITASVLDGAHPGAIVLAHDGGGDRWQTVDALEYYLPRLLDEGYTMVQPA
ncbi:polysaccharide deacetylase family protein [Streptomyces sp. A7024]|uniref:Polysaccharide deacetylase family protein n=1 Tax=Streptomyces coryli TaxID=1128680 RepID=A0A6G4UA39_9ACTN|nr:polysaccharide deacetylase family protein [Streptomyces coryli]NGN68556.1 polysaccharide deacetylase family protein [Streptomyces coryli]